MDAALRPYAVARIAVVRRVSDLRYVKVNQGFLEMTGYPREDVIGRSIYEVDVLAGVDKTRPGNRQSGRGTHHRPD